MSIYKRGRRKKRGSILLLAIFFLIVLFSLSVAFFRIIPAEYHSANNSRQKIQATYAGDSGARHAVAWLKNKWETNTAGIITEAEIAAYNVANYGDHEETFPVGGWQPSDLPSGASAILEDPNHKVDDDWSYLSRIRLDQSSFFKRHYTIESCAYFRGRPKQVTKVTVQNETFAEYALFYDEWDPDFIYSMTPNGIQGPVHTNDYLRVSAGDTNFWTATKSDGSPEDPWVSGPLARITHAGFFSADSTSPNNTLNLDGDGLQYANGNSFSADLGLVPYDDHGTPIANRYNKIVENGRENIRKIDPIDLPEENTYLRQDAWGGTPPNNNSEWNAALDGDEGYMVVQTDSGKVNDPSGEVAGGIFIRKRNADHVLFDITPEGHQKVRVRQGSTTVTDPTNITYKAHVPQYHRPIVHPAWDEPTEVCADWDTHMVDTWENVQHSEEITGPSASHCGTHQEYIPGEGGISTPITVPNVCTYTHTWSQWEVTGQHEESYCADWDPGPPIHHPEWTEWVDCESDNPDAVPNGTNYEVVDPTEYPDADEIVGTRNIQRWNSVVEVNDTDYQIPFYSGMKINGEEITDSNDPRLTVSDGHTVKIKNDYSDSNGDYAEYTVMNGRTNGVVFSDVHLRGVRGTVKGAKYNDGEGNLEYQGRVLATNLSGRKDIEIRDSIMQYYDGSGVDADGNPLNDGRNRLVPGNTSPTPEHILGIIGRYVSIRPSDRSHKYEDTDTANRETWFNGGHFDGAIDVYGIIMAGRTRPNGTVEGGFGSHDRAMDGNDNLGDFNLFGGIISAKARKTQRFTGGDNNGFRLGLNYDPVAAAFLGYFPQTNQSKPLRYVTYQP